MSPRPLDGYRVIDLCVVWAGPFATMLLGDLGAEVIKVENPFVFQPLTRGSVAHPPAAVMRMAPSWAGGFPNDDPGDKPFNYVPTFVSVFRNKHSFTANILKPEGMDVLARLVAKSDVVYENNATGTLEKLGITYEWLKQHNPNIIMVRVPAYGSSGPYAEARALGVHLEAVMGHTLLRGYDDADPSANTAIYSGDYLAGAQGAFAVMAALWHRERTGRGQLIEIAQAENAAAMFSQAIMDYTMNGRVAGAIGNRDVHGRHPSGVYPSLSPGDAGTMEDHWIAISVEDDDGWKALGRAFDSPAWAGDPRFATNHGRAEHIKEIDGLIAGYTRQHTDYDLAQRLQAAGVAAMPVLEASRMFDDPQLLAREFFKTQTVEGAGTHKYVGPLWKFSETPVEFYHSPTTFGEDNDYVYRKVLEMSDSEIDSLRAAGHIATDYDPSIP